MAYLLQTEDGIPPLQVRQLFEVGEGSYVGARRRSLLLPRLSCLHCATPGPVVRLTPDLEVALVRTPVCYRDCCTALCCQPACPPARHAARRRRCAAFGKELGRLNREALFGLLELVDTLVDRPSAYARLAENLGLVLRNAAYLLNLLRAHQARPRAQPGCSFAEQSSSVFFCYTCLAWQSHDSRTAPFLRALHACPP